MDYFSAIANQLVTVTVEEHPSRIQCIICKDNFTSRTERNEHLERHFIHRKCEHCDKAVIVIGDMEFELHRPFHCHRSTTDTTKLQPFVVLNRLSDSSPVRLPKKITPTRTVTASESESYSYLDYGDTLDENSYQEQNDVKFTPKIKNEEGKNYSSRKSRRKQRKVNYNEENDSYTLIKTESDLNVNKKSRRVHKIKIPKIKKEAETEDIVANHIDDENIENIKIEIDLPSDEPVQSAPPNEDEKLSNKKTKKNAEISCDLCGTKLTSVRMLNLHKKNVHGVQISTKCDICGRVMTSVGNLNQHKMTHAENKRYICSYCGKGFHLHHNLKEHIFEHTGDRPYKCEICDKNFRKKTARIVHMRVHTGEKPYKCPTENCDRAYAHVTDLKRHRRSVHGFITKTFECPICLKIFYENKFLTKHLNVHQ